MRVIFEEYGEGIIGAIAVIVVLPLICGVFKSNIPEMLQYVYGILFGGSV